MTKFYDAHNAKEKSSSSVTHHARRKTVFINLTVSTASRVYC